jgi:hypothetical protein
VTAQDIQQSWEAYTNAWADIDPTKREQLVKMSVSDDIDFSNPLIAGRGKAELIEAMTQFQKQFPGAHFELKTCIIHHDQLLSGWTLYGEDGSALLAGHNYARANAEGKLVYMSGFFAA